MQWGQWGQWGFCSLPFNFYFLNSYLNAYKEHNITHWGITIQNEPLGDFGFNAMLYTAEQQRDFLANTLGPELERSGWGTDKLTVMIWDFNMVNMTDWVKTIFADKTASKYAQGTAIHWYDRFHNITKDAITESHNFYPDKFILATEACEGRQKGVKLGKWSLAENYADDILQV